MAKDGRDGVLDIEVDRGVATYPQPLPGEDDRAGWGAAEGTSAYASIAALPSATVAVRRGEDELGRVCWGDVERDGRADAGQVVLELAEGGRNWVHVSVVDDATGRPVPCRVHFRSAAGIPYQPHGHHNHVTQNLGSWHYDVGGDVRLGQRSYAYIDGTCQGWLPRGDVVVRVFAHTSPVYLACGGDWTMTDPEGIRYIRTLVEGAREYVRHTAVRRSDQLTTHHHGEADHLAWLERPFAEALRALEERSRP